MGVYLMNTIDLINKHIHVEFWQKPNDYFIGKIVNYSSTYTF